MNFERIERTLERIADCLERQEDQASAPQPEAIRQGERSNAEADFVNWLRSMERSRGIWENGPSHLAKLFLEDQARKRSKL